MEIRADRGERRFQILERLLRLRPDVTGDPALAVDPELSGDVDDARRPCDLDHMGVTGRLSQCLRIDESGLGHAILLDQAFTDAEYSKHTAACAGIGAAYPRLTGHGASPSLPFALGAFKWLANSSRRTFSSASTR